MVNPRAVERVLLVIEIDEAEVFNLLLITTLLPSSEAVAFEAKVVSAFNCETIDPFDVATPVGDSATEKAVPSIVPASVAAPPPAEVSTEAALSVAAAFAFCSKLPSKALADRSPACTWKATVDELKANCCLPLASVLIDAVMLAFFSAVPCCVPPLAALPIALFTAVTRSEVPPKLAVFTEILTPLPSKPGPFKTKVVNPAATDELVLIELLKIEDRLVPAEEPAPMSVPVAPNACTPVRPRLRASTVDLLKSTDTEPFVIWLTPLFVLPPPMNTCRFCANAPF